MKNVEKSRFLQEFQQKYEKFWQKFAKILSFERCKGETILQISKKLTLQNEYLDAKIGVDTAENEPSKV